MSKSKDNRYSAEAVMDIVNASVEEAVAKWKRRANKRRARIKEWRKRCKQLEEQQASQIQQSELAAQLRGVDKKLAEKQAERIKRLKAENKRLLSIIRGTEQIMRGDFAND